MGDRRRRSGAGGPGTVPSQSGPGYVKRDRNCNSARSTQPCWRAADTSAFSRYENGSATPVAAVTTLFALLENHPELLPEARALAGRLKEFRQGENQAELPQPPVSRKKGGMHAGIDPMSNRSMFDAADDRGAY